MTVQYIHTVVQKDQAFYFFYVFVCSWCRLRPYLVCVMPPHVFPTGTAIAFGHELRAFYGR